MTTNSTQQESASDNQQTSLTTKNRKKATLESKTFNDGAIYLYRRPDYKKPTWRCRIKVPHAKGYLDRSTGAANEHEAYKFASDLYNKSLVKVLSGGDLQSKRIKIAIDAYKKHLDPHKSIKSIHYKLLLITRLTPFFQTKTFEELNTSLLSKAVDELTSISERDRLSPNTVKRIFSDLKHFLNWCVEEGYLDEVPPFPKVSAKESRRPHFTSHEYTKLTRHLRKFVKVENRAIRRDRIMLKNYILILANTGIRVGEARQLKWRDLSERGGNVFLSVRGKTGQREVVARTSEVKTYFGDLLAMRLEEIKADDGFEVDMNSFVFCHRNGTPIESFKKSFQTLLKEVGVEKDSHGAKHTIYSLRHTYATFRLQNGVNHYTLAKNMGTSVAMIEQFYGHTTNAEMAKELTKSSGRKTAEKVGALDWLK